VHGGSVYVFHRTQQAAGHQRHANAENDAVTRRQLKAEVLRVEGARDSVQSLDSIACAVTLTLSTNSPACSVPIRVRGSDAADPRFGATILQRQL
jgi:hypothetical protein